MHTPGTYLQPDAQGEFPETLSEEEVAGLHQGSYVILKQRAGEFAQIIRSGKIVARGEVCIADDTFAIRVVEVIHS